MQLRHYQQEIATATVDLLKTYKIAYLAMQVRTGKTITSLEAAKLYGASTVLFVTKKKAISSIEADYLPNYKQHFVMYCINYESIHLLPNVRYDLIILDEAHALGQYPQPSDRTENIKKLAINTPIIYLSGTPTPESYSQIYHQLWVSSYSPFAEFKNFYKWAEVYVYKRVKFMYNRSINDYSQANDLLIKQATSHLFLTYTQEEAGFDMQVNEHFHYVKLHGASYDGIKKLKRDKLVRLKSGRFIEADTEVKLMGKLHQMYSGTVITTAGGLVEDDGEAVTFDTSKMDYINDNFDDKKIAIFYKFQEELNMIREICHLNPNRNLTNNPVIFNNTDKNCWFVSQIQSGREGINLSSADCLVMLNIDFSAVSYWQSRARLQTKDRTTPADVHWIFAENGIEQRIYQAVSNKKDYTLNYFKKDML